jgi:4-amino-4-deoxy-L-arabinose transferase-like glycosyltransferase
MFQMLNHRGCHYAILALVWALVSLPNLGAPGLWDIDEGNNASAAGEMLASGSPIVPTFDYQLRVDKPALLYWLQMAAYSRFGVNEFSARLPSALAALIAVVIAYELGRCMFGAMAGLLAGLMLASATLFCASAHFANPDALLDACTALALFVFWRGYRKQGSLPYGTVGAISGLGMLAKGPVALVLPGAVAILFLTWQRELRRLADWRLARGVLTFALVAAPWYTWVGVETKGQWLKGFFWTHNIQRWLGGFFLLRGQPGFDTPMENHGGPLYYYLLVLLIGFAPWSVFFGPAAWSTWRERSESDRPALRFLTCWIAVFLVFFTLSGTKLPNYILPLYPAVAILTGRAVNRWWQGLSMPPTALFSASLVCLALVGVAVAVGCLAAAGVFPAGVPIHRQLPALANLAVLGAVPVIGAIAAATYLRRQARTGMLFSVAASGVLFSGSLAAFGPVVVDRYKAPRALAAALPADQTFHDVRVGAYEYFQPSLVFYCRREVSRLDNEAAVRALLEGPLPAFLFVPAAVWDELRTKTVGREVARHHDLYDGREIVLVTNGL